MAWLRRRVVDGSNGQRDKAYCKREQKEEGREGKFSRHVVCVCGVAEVCTFIQSEIESMTYIARMISFMVCESLFLYVCVCDCDCDCVCACALLLLLFLYVPVFLYVPMFHIFC
jgi:hypothetical protein